MAKYGSMHAAAMDKYAAATKEERRRVSAKAGLVNNQDPRMEERDGYRVTPTDKKADAVAAAAPF